MANPWGVSRRHPPFFRTNKLALLGCTQTLRFAPWFDRSWTLAAHPAVYRRVLVEPDWWFDLHGPQNFRKGKDWNPTYLHWLKTLTDPIFMQKDWPDIPMAVRFPKERLLAEFRPYFTNHVAWMIALAMTEGITHIGLFGCEYQADQERGLQRGSCEYWLGRFEGAGGHVVLPPTCSLMAVPKQLYGYESHDEEGKLISAYRPPVQKKVVASPDKPPTSLTLIDEKVSTRPPLMTIPGEPVAWEYSGHTIHA